MIAVAEQALTEAAAASAILPSTDSAESDVPTIETAGYTRSLPRWRKCRDLMEGVEAIRRGSAFYLPQYAGESNALYYARQTISALFNGFARTVLAIVGLITQPEPVLGKDMPQTLVDMWENVEGAGKHGAVFTSELVTAGVVDGFAGIITEYPRANDPRIDRSKASRAATVALETGGELDAADVAALGLRPYFILCKADEVLPVYETVNGKRTLVMLIRKEVATERKGRFGRETVTRYRVYELVGAKVVYERWTASAAGARPERDEGPTEMKNLQGIPWSPLITGGKLGENEYKPALMDLAELNLTHHRIATGILSLQEQAFVPTIVRVGARPDSDGAYPPIVTGPGNTIEAPDTPGVSTPVYYLSPPVDVLEPGSKSLENCKAEMGAMGASFLAPQPVQETATAKRMDSSAERATVGTMSRAAKDCLESAFGFAGQYIKTPAGSITVNEDFGKEGIDTAVLSALMQNFQSDKPVVGLEELRHYLKTGQLPENFDPADKKIIEELAGMAAAREEQARIEAEALNATRDSVRRKAGGGIE
jgi:hypothetical protein